MRMKFYWTLDNSTAIVWTLEYAQPPSLVQTLRVALNAAAADEAIYVMAFDYLK